VIGLRGNLRRRAGAFAAEEERVVRCERELIEPQRRVGLDQDQPARTRGGEGGEGRVPRRRDLIPIIEGGALQRPIGQREAAGLNNVEADAKAGREADRRAQILRDVRLIEG